MENVRYGHPGIVRTGPCDRRDGSSLLYEQGRDDARHRYSQKDSRRDDVQSHRPVARCGVREKEMSSQEKMDFFELGDKTSLICADPATTEAVKGTLREIGFKFHVAETPELAIERMRYTNYDCIIIHENFAGSTLRTNAVLTFLAALPMAQRRYWFVCLVGPSFKTLDALQAFAQSVHLVLNPADLSNLTAILKKSLAEFELLYRAYKESLAAM